MFYYSRSKFTSEMNIIACIYEINSNQTLSVVVLIIHKQMSSHAKYLAPSPSISQLQILQF